MTAGSGSFVRRRNGTIILQQAKGRHVISMTNPHSSLACLTGVKAKISVILTSNSVKSEHIPYIVQRVLPPPPPWESKNRTSAASHSKIKQHALNHFTRMQARHHILSLITTMTYGTWRLNSEFTRTPTISESMQFLLEVSYI